MLIDISPLKPDDQLQHLIRVMSVIRKTLIDSSFVSPVQAGIQYFLITCMLDAGSRVFAALRPERRIEQNSPELLNPGQSYFSRSGNSEVVSDHPHCATRSCCRPIAYSLLLLAILFMHSTRFVSRRIQQQRPPDAVPGRQHTTGMPVQTNSCMTALSQITLYFHTGTPGNPVSL